MTRAPSPADKSALTKVTIATDGACKGNPGRGGWGAVLRYGDKLRTLSGHEAETTNNRMELLAAIEALAALKRPCRVTLVTDSRYVRDGITQWIDKWQRNGWRTAKKKPIANEDLWRRLLTESERHDIDWQWVRGHTGHPDNEQADKLASNQAELGGDAGGLSVSLNHRARDAS